MVALEAKRLQRAKRLSGQGASRKSPGGTDGKSPKATEEAIEAQSQSERESGELFKACQAAVAQPAGHFSAENSKIELALFNEAKAAAKRAAEQQQSLQRSSWEVHDQDGKVDKNDAGMDTGSPSAKGLEGQEGREGQAHGSDSDSAAYHRSSGDQAGRYDDDQTERARHLEADPHGDPRLMEPSGRPTTEAEKKVYDRTKQVWFASVEEKHLTGLKEYLVECGGYVLKHVSLCWCLWCVVRGVCGVSDLRKVVQTEQLPMFTNTHVRLYVTNSRKF